MEWSSAGLVNGHLSHKISWHLGKMGKQEGLQLIRSSRRKLVFLKKEHLTCLSDNCLVLKIEETMSVTPVLSFLTSIREKKNHQW